MKSLPTRRYHLSRPSGNQQPKHSLLPHAPFPLSFTGASPMALCRGTATPLPTPPKPLGWAPIHDPDSATRLWSKLNWIRWFSPTIGTRRITALEMHSTTVEKGFLWEIPRSPVLRDCCTPLTRPRAHPWWWGEVPRVDTEATSSTNTEVNQQRPILTGFGGARRRCPRSTRHHTWMTEGASQPRFIGAERAKIASTASEDPVRVSSDFARAIPSSTMRLASGPTVQWV
jgi:hypothetical protein